MDPSSPNYAGISEDTPFYWTENTPTSLPDSLPEHYTQTPEPEIGQSGISARPPKSRKRISEVWQFYDIIDFPNNGKRAVCKKCKKDFSCSTSGGTGHLKRHADKHAANQNERTQTQINFSEMSISSFLFDNEKARKEIAKFIIQNEQPFYLAENPAFVKMLIRGFNPNFKSVSRNTMRKYCLVIYHEYKHNLLSELTQGHSKISLTSDIWTSQFKTDYICITGHYIDKNWMLQKRILNFFELEHRHTGSVIAGYIMRCIHEYRIERYIFSITLDNASANNSAVEILKNNLNPKFSGIFFHVRCACHILNLCVKDGLELIEPYIERVRNAILNVRNGSFRRNEFKRFCTDNGKTFKKYLIDVDHRWNSTYEMLNCAYEDRDIITSFCIQHCPEDPISSLDWETSNLVKEFLEVFYNATNIFSGVYYPTTCLTINQLYFISEIFEKFRHDYTFEAIVAPMELKFKKYFGKILPLSVLAMFVDPRFKIDGTFFLIDSIDDNMGYDHALRKEEYRTLFYDMYNEYYKLHGAKRSSNPSPSIETTSSSSKKKSTAHVLNMIRQKLTSGASSSSSSSPSSTTSTLHELNLYLSNNFNDFLTTDEIENFDILSWWKAQENNYPVLAAMARDLLTPPMSTVASESSFSAGRRVLDDRRSRMNQVTVEMCICLKDWLDAEDRIQDKREPFTGDDGGQGIYTDSDGN